MIALMQVTASAAPEELRMSAALYLKNTIARFWEDKSDRPQLLPQDKAVVRDNILAVLVSASPVCGTSRIFRSLSACFRCFLIFPHTHMQTAAGAGHLSHRRRGPPRPLALHCAQIVTLLRRL